MGDREYKVSVVTAVYNVEAYLGEMIESIIRQHIICIRKIHILARCMAQPFISRRRNPAIFYVYCNNVIRIPARVVITDIP